MIYKTFVTVFVCLLFLFSAVPLAFAQNQESTVYLPANETFEGLYIKTAKNITIDGTINGEAYLIGESIIVNGNVNGDLIAVGSNVDVNGNISDNVRIISFQSTISGNVGKNLTVLSAKNNVENKTAVGGNMVAVSGDSQIFGKVGGESYIISRQLFFGGQSTRKAYLNSPKLTIGKGATFGGALEYVTKNEIKSLDTQVKGKLQHTSVNEKLMFPLFIDNGKMFISQQFKTLAGFFNFLGYLIVGLILSFIFPRSFTNISRTILDKPLASFIAGVLFYVIFPFVFLSIVLTIIGIPIALLAVLLLAAIAFSSRIVVSLAVGNLILKDETAKFLPLIIGLTITQIIYWIPFFGFIARLIVIAVGSGGILLSKFGRIGK